MIEPKLTNLTPLPGELLYPDDSKMAEEYDKLPEDVKLNERDGKHWSIYQLMKYFHSGILPEHSDVNYFEFAIDLTSPHLKIANIDDPTMVQEVNSTMLNGLQSLATKIQGLIGDLQVEASNKALELTTTAMSNKAQRGGKKRKGGGLNDAPSNTAEKLKQLLSPQGIEAECLKDLFRVKLDTWDRIFVTNAKKDHLPLASQLNLKKSDPMVVKEIEDAVREQEKAGPDIQQVGGRRRYKTRKGRKYGKKVKTHRRRR